jgi:hypothetical protein
MTGALAATVGSGRNSALKALAAAVAVLSLAAGASSATRPAPKTLVAERGRIHAVAQDTNAIAWIGTHYEVRVRRLSPARTFDLGSGAHQQYLRTTHPLALAGLQVLWTTVSAGNFVYTDVHTGAPSIGDSVVFNLVNDPGYPQGSYLGGMAGQGSTLVFGATGQRCDDEYNCRRLDVDGNVERVTTSAVALPGLPPPILLATSQGRVAVVPAKTPRLYPDISAPRAAEYAPVQVYDTIQHLISTVVPDGTPRAIALAWPKLAVLVEHVDGSRRIQLYDARTGGYWASGGEAVFTNVPVTVSRVSVGTPGTVYSAGNAIYLLRRQQPQLVWRAAASPVGLSIFGNRIVWGENVKGHGRIRALTVR